MPHPFGNYPGRNFFLGLTVAEQPGGVYQATSRSFRARYAKPFPEEFAVRMIPTKKDEPLDPRLHYRAVARGNGIVVVSNNDAPVDSLVRAFEAACEFRQPLLNEQENLVRHVLAKHGNEQDNKKDPSNHTPRIAGALVPSLLRPELVSVHFGIAYDKEIEHTAGYSVQGPQPGVFWGISTYDGEVDYHPLPRERLGRTVLETGARTAEELTEELDRRTDYVDPVRGDFNVSVIAFLVDLKKPLGLDVAIRNHSEPEA